MGNFLKTRFAQALTGIYIDPCDPNHNTYAQLAWGAIFNGLFTYAYPGWKDDVDLATGQSWLKHARRRLDAAKPNTPHWLTPAGEFLGTTAEELDKRAWQLFTIETLAGTALQWASAAYVVEPCKPGAIYSYWNSKNPLGFWDNQDGWADGPIWIVDNGNQGAVQSSSVTIPPGGGGYLVVAADYGKFVGFGNLIGWSSRMVESGGKVVQQHSWSPRPGEVHGGPIDFWYMPPVPQQRVLQYQWQPIITGGFTETYVYRGYGAACWWTSEYHKWHRVIGRAPRAYDFKSVTDPYFYQDQ
jgi:hypothetical protein